MRTLIPIVILAALAYVGWFYLQSFTDRPLQENLLLTDTNTLRELIVTNDKRTFRMFRGEERGWVVKQDAIELYDQSEAVDKLVEFLNQLQTDSVVYGFPPEPGLDLALSAPDGRREVLKFRFPAGSPPVVRVGATGDVFALSASVRVPLLRMLRFDTYRGHKSLKIEPGEVDSIAVLYHDSLRWRVPQVEVSRLSKTFITPAFSPDEPPPYADYFDEVMDREKYFATLTLYAVADSHYIEVFRDSQWVRPYVLVGEDFPRRYFALDSLR
jgi:hypothetical protein